MPINEEIDEELERGKRRRALEEDAGEEQQAAAAASSEESPPAAAAAGGEEAEEDGEGDETAGMPEGARQRYRSGPSQPTMAEREQHNLNHWPPRNWCRWCVASRSISSPHPSSSSASRGVPIVSLDYFYPDATREESAAMEARQKELEGKGAEVADDEVPPGATTAIAIHDSQSKSVYSFAVSRKGACHDAIVRTVDVLEYLGYRKVVVQTDQGPALMSLSRAVRARWTGESTPEESPAYTPAANGAVERAIRSIKEQRQCMLSALQDHLRVDSLPTGHAILSWLTEYAAYILRHVR